MEYWLLEQAKLAGKTPRELEGHSGHHRRRGSHW